MGIVRSADAVCIVLLGYEVIYRYLYFLHWTVIHPQKRIRLNTLVL